jgi:HEAT repeat protein
MACRIVLLNSVLLSAGCLGLKDLSLVRFMKVEPTTVSVEDKLDSGIEFTAFKRRSKKQDTNQNSLAEILQQTSWRPHPQQSAWLDCPWQVTRVPRWVLSYNAESEAAVTAKADANADAKAEPKESADQTRPSMVPGANEEPAKESGNSNILPISELLHANQDAHYVPVPDFNATKVDGSTQQMLLEELRDLSTREDRVGDQACLLIALLDNSSPPHVVERLTKQVQTFPSSLKPKEIAEARAVVSGWCRALLAAQGSDKSEVWAALAPAGELLNSQKLAPELRAELHLQLVQWLPPIMIPNLTRGLRPADTSGVNETPVILRASAIEACLIYAWEHAKFDTGLNSDASLAAQTYPAEIWQAEWDDDRRVRQYYANFVALVHPPEGLKILQRQLMDHDIAVRDSALMAIGYWHDDEARKILEKYAKRPEENVRVATVRGLGTWGPTALQSMLKDESHRVRKEVAAALAYQPSAQAGQMLRLLIDDANTQVQMQALESTTHWPDEFAFPVVLQGMVQGHRPTRLKSAYLIQQRKQIIVEQIDGTASERLAYMQQLANANGLPQTYFAQQFVTQTSRSDELHTQDVNQWLESLLSKKEDQAPETEIEPKPSEMVDFTNLNLQHRDLYAVEKFLHEHQTGEVKTQILEKLGKSLPEYEALKMLSNSDVFVRRQGAKKLVVASQSATLSPLLMDELYELVKQEQDEQVWRSIAEAISHDSGQGQIRIVRLLLRNRWGDLQKLGCQYVEKHRVPELGIDLLPLLASSDRLVQMAAINAAGYCGNPILINGLPQTGDTMGTSNGLRMLLNDANPRVRQESAIALARLRDGQGIVELVRLSHSPEAQLRHRVVKIMGELGGEQYVGQLIQLLWIEKEPAIRSSILEALQNSVPENQEPPTVKNANFQMLKVEEQKNAWHEWWAQRHQLKTP